jgi:peptidyl-prolyl cis-trans isomerase C
MMKRWLMSASLLLPLAACGTGAPEGQVVATVNGDEITRAELNSELRQLNVPTGTGKQDVQNQVLDRMVTQRLIVQAAKQEDLDKSQDYVLQKRKADDAILTSLFAHKVTGDIRVPYEGDIARFIQANPWRFDQREQILVNQVRVPTAKIDKSWFKGGNSLEEIAAGLKARNIAFQQGKAAIDSATLPKPAYEQLQKLKPGQPFAVEQQNLTIFSAIAGHQPSPLDAKTAHDLAGQLLQQQNNETALSNRLKALRQSAKIQYQNGFSAPPSKPGA